MSPTFIVQFDWNVAFYPLVDRSSNVAAERVRGRMELMIMVCRRTELRINVLIRLQVFSVALLCAGIICYVGWCHVVRSARLSLRLNFQIEGSTSQVFAFARGGDAAYFQRVCPGLAIASWHRNRPLILVFRGRECGRPF